MNNDKAQEKAVREFRRMIARAIAIQHLKQHRQAQAKLNAKAGEMKPTRPRSNP